MVVTKEQFKAATGNDPILDDLERCNCPQVGQIGHYYCGWCEKCDKPRFLCHHIYIIHREKEFKIEKRPKR